MSAFVVDKAHVDAMISLALEGPEGLAVAPGYWPRPFAYYDGDAETIAEAQEMRREIRLEDADELGRMLWGTNALSVRTRYPDLYEEGTYPGTFPGWTVEDDVFEYRYERPRVRPTAVEGLKLLACFEYQSCEFSGWKGHPAQRFCETLAAALVNVLPGYAEAPWEWTGEPVQSR